ncbi:hypothetical protein D1007_14451 [Hordeum vulgare]|uniref:Uncharacterized protein n=1 Tax=Hordeum vulgare subsp. vulgare TaxID=112509 RepID=A0A8I6WMR7_HORVV|nr:uncharacterized protein LOC123429927 isoform X2 [Hordeum vulgare subsp. vulgare]KAE8809022.1 hypothetical protein D1007_14451 [Hordeum vulgare]
MALRSLLTKMPALGSRSLPMAPAKLPVHALSPAAGSRLFHHGDTDTGQMIYSEDSLARLREKTNKQLEQLTKDLKNWEEGYKDYDWRQDEDYIKFRKTLREIEMACYVVLFITVPGTAAMLYNLF